MNRLITAAVLSFAIATPALAQTVPVPVPRPAHLHRANAQVSTFQKVMPNGIVRQCRVERHFEQHRGLVRTQTCWRAR